MFRKKQFVVRKWLLKYLSLTLGAFNSIFILLTQKFWGQLMLSWQKKRQHKHLEFMIAPSQQSWSSLARVSLMSEVLLWEKPLLNKNVCFVKKEHWTWLNTACSRLGTVLPQGRLNNIAWLWLWSIRFWCSKLECWNGKEIKLRNLDCRHTS